MSEVVRLSADTLYYDGMCPLCRREIHLLRRIQRGGLCFADIHQIAPGENLPSRQVLLQTLHLRTATGEWLTGIQATARAWGHTRWGWLFRPLSWSWISPVAHRVYRRWADRRYRRLYGCTVCMGGEE